MSMPFDCMDLAYMLDTSTSTLYTLNLVTGMKQNLFTLSQNLLTYNLIYNHLDQLLYFYEVHTHQLCKLDSNAQVSPCYVDALPHKAYNALALDPKGMLYLYHNLDSEIYTINLNENAPDYLDVQSYPITPVSLSSWCAHPHLPYLYILNTAGQIVQLDPTTGVFTPLITHGLSTLTQYQMFFDYDGILYIIHTAKNTIYRVTIQENIATCEVFCILDYTIHSAYLSRSLLSPLLLSLGTAPPPYITSLVENGPRHAYSALLTLTTVTPLPKCSLAHSTYELNVEVTNHTGKTANLYGWVDWNQNGTFEPSEALEPILVPYLLNTTQKVVLHFKRPPIESIKRGTTYMRLRITTDHLDTKKAPSLSMDSRSIGPVSDGEILDLPVVIEAPPPCSEGTLYEKVLVGELLESHIQASDPCGGKLIYALESPPTKGKVVLNETTGYFTYTPHLKPFTKDSFSVRTTSLISHLDMCTPVQISIEKAALQVDFVPSHTEITPQDTLTYTATLRNIGSLPLDHLLFTVNLPKGMEYIKGSVMINGIQDLVTLPNFGISLVKLLPDDLCTITFATTLNELCPDELTPSCITQCTYTLNPLDKASSLKVEKAAIPCHLKHPHLHMELIANTHEAFLEDLVQYTLLLKNTGDLPLTQIHLSLALPLEMAYRGDFTCNHLLTQCNLLEGYTIASMSPQETHQLQFKASPITSSSTTSLTTIIFSQYTYTLNNKPHICDRLSASHQLTLHQPSFTLTKQASKTALSLGETFTYTLCATNASQVPIQEVILKETIPPFLQVLMIKQNEQPLRNTLEEGLSLGLLPPHTTKCITVDLKVMDTPSITKVLSYPTTGIFKILIGNYEKILYVEAPSEQEVLLTRANLLLTKHTSTQEVVVGETISYEIHATNTGTLKLTHVQVEDLLTPELKFIPGSVSIDHLKLPQASLISGIHLDTLLVGATKVITFDALILSDTKNTIENSCSASYTYLPFGSPQEKIGFAKSEPCHIHILNPNLEVLGSVNKSLAYLHDQLDYTFYIRNTGDVDAVNVMIQNTSCCIQLIDGSFKVNDTLINSVELGTFINIGTLLKGDTSLITFSVQVVGSPRHENTITTEMTAKFMYYTSAKFTKYKTCPTFTLTTPLTPSTFKQVSLEHSLELPYDKPDLEIINTIDGQVNLIKAYLIQTPKGVSSDGQTLTGCKLMVHALLDMSVEYASNEQDSCVCTAHYSLPFSTFIVLPPDTQLHTKVHVDFKIQNISWRPLNNRCFFSCNAILVMARLH